MSELVQEGSEAENKAYKILGWKMIKVWLKAKDNLIL